MRMGVILKTQDVLEMIPSVKHIVEKVLIKNVSNVFIHISSQKMEADVSNLSQDVNTLMENAHLVLNLSYILKELVELGDVKNTQKKAVMNALIHLNLKETFVSFLSVINTLPPNASNVSQDTS